MNPNSISNPIFFINYLFLPFTPSPGWAQVHWHKLLIPAGTICNRIIEKYTSSMEELVLNLKMHINFRLLIIAMTNYFYDQQLLIFKTTALESARQLS